ncbi:MAG: hypothetical protein C0468_02905 [Planctomyces sp.]|nr:hypothetical protein [Planctomyces sp.]MBA4119687.1 hypothetical protein [Isosphaera sp.]
MDAIDPTVPIEQQLADARRALTRARIERDEMAHIARLVLDAAASERPDWPAVARAAAASLDANGLPRGWWKEASP